MEKKISSVAVCLVILAVLVSGAVSQERIFEKGVSKPVQWYKPGELIVKFRADTSEKIIEQINFRYGISQLYKSSLLGFRKLRVPRGKNVFDLADALSREANVKYARPNYVCRAFFIPNDEYYSYQWNFDLIDMEQAWDVESGDPGVVVAILDTGVAYENYRRLWKRYYLAPDLGGTNFVAGYDFIEGDSHPNDDEGHGTHVTGTIAQTTNNSIGVAGVAFNCSIMPVKVLDSTGAGTSSSLADGILYAANNGAKVINMSLGFPPDIVPEDIPVVTEAVQYAYSKGCVLVGSSGNEGVDTVSLPAGYPGVIAVGAVHSGDARADYSQYGPQLELVAPGGDEEDRDGDGYIDGVLQQSFGNNTRDWGYWFYTGTSCAAPHVSGLAALLLSQNPALGNEEVRELMCGTAVDLGPAGRDDEYGYGRIDAYAALTGEIIPNEHPVANPGGPYTGVEDTPVVFDGSASFDPDGDPLTYSWDFGDGSQGSGMSPSHTYTGGGEYVVTLVVNDGKADSEPATTTAAIEGLNDPPVADAGADQSVSDADGTGFETVTLDGSASFDADGVISSYKWMEGQVVLGTAAVVSRDFSAGTHTVTLTVTDDQDDSASDDVVIIVNANQSPTAEAGPDRNGSVGQTLNFDGSGSSDPDGSIVSYHWDFGDSSSGTGVGVTHTYAAVGTYTVILTVTDNGGLTGQDSATVTVTEEPAEIEVFYDGFEVGEWNGLWTEDSQNDWFRSTQRAVDGSHSAEVDGRASDAQLISVPIDLQGRTSAAISFFWYIEKTLDGREYLAFDVSTDGGANWIEKARLSGNVDPEDTWHDVSIDLTGIDSLKIRFRAKMSRSNEDANVDAVKVIAR